MKDLQNGHYWAIVAHTPRQWQIIRVWITDDKTYFELHGIDMLINARDIEKLGPRIEQPDDLQIVDSNSPTT